MANLFQKVFQSTSLTEKTPAATANLPSTSARLSPAATPTPQVTDNSGAGRKSFLQDAIAVGDKVSRESFSSTVEKSIQANPLNKYWQPTYHFRLFMAGDVNILDNISSIQDLLSKVNGNSLPQVVIAESGVTGYNIRDVEITSVNSQNAQTREQKLTTMTMTVTEPLGISFLDALFGAASYLKVFDYTKMTYFLMLSFTGYDETGAFAGNPLDLGFTNGGQWLWALKLTLLETKINEGGGVYTLHFVTTESEPLILEQKILSTNEAGLTVKGKTVGAMFDSFAEKMTAQWNEKFSDPKLGQSLMKFEIKTHPIPWLSPELDPKDFVLVNQTNEKDPQRSKSLDFKILDGIPTAQVPPSVTINEFITSAIKATEQGQTLIKDVPISPEIDQSASDTNPKRMRASTLFAVEPVLDSVSKDPKSGNYIKHVTLHVVPTYSQGSILSRTQTQDAGDPQVQRSMIQELAKHGFLKKRYDYIFTGLNTEVIDFRIDFNLAWQAALPKLAGFRLSAVNTAINARRGEPALRCTALSQSQENQGSKETELAIVPLEPPPPGKVYVEDLLSRLNQNQNTLLGPNASLPISFWWNNKDIEREKGVGFAPQQDRGLSTVGAVMAQVFDNSLTTAFQRVELTIRGDPFWLGQGNLHRQINLASGSIHNPNDLPDYSTGNPAIILRFRYPIQIGEDFKPELKESEVFNGIYEVTVMKHNFSEGAFKQTVTAVRMPLINLGLANVADPSSINSDQSSTPIAATSNGATIATGFTPNTHASNGSANPDDPRGIRNNNPTNLGYFPGQTNVQGSDGRFGVYPSMEDGVAAATNQLVINQNRDGLTTVSQQITRWAPSSDGNNTTAYINFVSNKMGVGPNDRIDVTNPATAQTMIGAMVQKENGRSIDPAVIQAGVAKRLSS